jgi:hypothetical protein
LQSFETELCDSRRAQLSTIAAELLLNTIDNGGETTWIHVAFVGGAGEAPEHLLAVEGLARAVALDHLEGLRDRPLIGGEAVTAGGALAAPADAAVRDAAGLEGLGGGVAAGTVHSSQCTEA